MLAEKAYVQANQFGWIRPGLPGNGQNSYSGIEGGYIYAATGHITGPIDDRVLRRLRPLSNFTTFVNAWNAGKTDRLCLEGDAVVEQRRRQPRVRRDRLQLVEPNDHALQSLGPQLRAPSR